MLIIVMKYFVVTFMRYSCARVRGKIEKTSIPRNSQYFSYVKLLGCKSNKKPNVYQINTKTIKVVVGECHLQPLRK